MSRACGGCSLTPLPFFSKSASGFLRHVQARAWSLSFVTSLPSTDPTHPWAHWDTSNVRDVPRRHTRAASARVSIDTALAISRNVAATLRIRRGRLCTLSRIRQRFCQLSLQFVYAAPQRSLVVGLSVRSLLSTFCPQLHASFPDRLSLRSRDSDAATNASCIARSYSIACHSPPRSARTDSYPGLRLDLIFSDSHTSEKFLRLSFLQ